VSGAVIRPGLPWEGAAAPAAPGAVPWLGLAAVLLGTFLSTLNGQLSTFGLADIRGAIHAGFDEGAWITTAQAIAQVMVAPLAVWMGSVYGPRRVLIYAALAFAAISLLKPAASDLAEILALQFAGGLASGFFIPLTIGFVLKSLPPRYWTYGIAIYALNLETSLNISASFEGFYVDQLSWRWIFWQSVPIALAMAGCLYLGTNREAPITSKPALDRFGMLTCGSGLALIYAALDQGNRVDWFNAAQTWALFGAGGIILISFVVHELRSQHPFLDLSVVVTPPLPAAMSLIALLRLTILSTAFLIPTYLGGVRGFRALETGQTLIWIAAPQLLVCLAAGYVLRRVDTRMVACGGFLLICVACLIDSHGLTPLWGSDQFLHSQLLQAVGQSFALTGIVFFAVQNLRPAAALSLGAVMQIARLMGGEAGQAFIATFIRVRSQIASNLIGLHVNAGDSLVQQRLQIYAAVTARAGDPQSGPERGAAVLGAVVRSAATTQAVMDAFLTIGLFAALAMLVMVAQRAPPLNPAAPRGLFSPAKETPR